jgi:hypothetical protein
LEINRTFVFHPSIHPSTPYAMANLACSRRATDCERKNWGYSPWGQIEGSHLVGWKFTSIACFVQQMLAYECTHVWASEKKRYLWNWLSTERVKILVRVHWFGRDWVESLWCSWNARQASDRRWCVRVARIQTPELSSQFMNTENECSLVEATDSHWTLFREMNTVL